MDPQECGSSWAQGQDRSCCSDNTRCATRELPFFFFFFFFCLYRASPQHMEVPRLGVESELQLPAYTAATATPNPSHVYSLHHSSRQRRIPHPLSEAKDRTCVLMDPSQIFFRCATMGTSQVSLLSNCSISIHSIITSPASRLVLTSSPLQVIWYSFGERKKPLNTTLI